MILRGLNVDITMVILMFFLKCICFRKGVFLVFFWKRRGEKRDQREIQGAQNSGNPYAKVTILVFFVFSIVRILRKSEKIVKSQSSFGCSRPMKMEGFHYIF